MGAAGGAKGSYLEIPKCYEQQGKRKGAVLSGPETTGVGGFLLGGSTGTLARVYVRAVTLVYIVDALTSFA